ncbi:PTS cellobiose transporter subunit IIC [Marinisporobacter balticus]|uniref:Permease IIC component n=1 Tax=Marinisporobacter balticus TaxID=2018667 RepID=A0A4R2LCA1_9FIRM|nr:PTS cellobiose transporter subunit IIC [Marinisporobacter balticus]TCO76945.1 PTS system cellobiose-specific IIC component [Marinisporobacter balticus]
MNKVNYFLEEKVMPVAGRIANQKHLQSVRDGLALAMPLLIIGSLFLLISAFPIPGYREFMTGIFGDMWRSKILYPVNVTFDVMSIFASFGIAYRLAEKYSVDPLSAAAISLSSFLLVTPLVIPFTPTEMTETFMVNGIPIKYMGSQGLFVAIIIAIISTEIYRRFIQKDIVIKMPQGVPPAVSMSFAALIPAGFILSLMLVLRIGIEHTSFENIHNIITKLITVPLSLLGGSLGGIIISVFIVGLFWSMGIHGWAVVSAVMSPIWLILRDQNRMIFMADSNAILPNIATDQFFLLWVFLGGAGATLAFTILLTFRAKSKQLKSLGKLSFGSAIFNINEPIIFGSPIVMNPILMLPFIFIPVITALTTYFAMHIGFVEKPCGIAVPWTTPIIISGYLAAGGKISGSIMQIINFIISLALYYPFFRMWDKKKCEEEDIMEEMVS